MFDENRLNSLSAEYDILNDELKERINKILTTDERTARDYERSENEYDVRKIINALSLQLNNIKYQEKILDAALDEIPADAVFAYASKLNNELLELTAGQDDDINTRIDANTAELVEKLRDQYSKAELNRDEINNRLNEIDKEISNTINEFRDTVYELDASMSETDKQKPIKIAFDEIEKMITELRKIKYSRSKKTRKKIQYAEDAFEKIKTHKDTQIDISTFDKLNTIVTSLYRSTGAAELSPDERDVITDKLNKVTADIDRIKELENEQYKLLEKIDMIDNYEELLAMYYAIYDVINKMKKLQSDKNVIYYNLLEQNRKTKNSKEKLEYSKMINELALDKNINMDSSVLDKINQIKNLEVQHDELRREIRRREQQYKISYPLFK